MKHWRTHSVWIAARVLWLGAAIYFASVIFAPSATRLTHGFISYFTAAQLAREGQAGPQMYDPAWFRPQTLRVSNGDANDILNANPPAIVLLFLPLTVFPVHTARLVWTILNVFLLGGAFVLLTRATGISTTRAFFFSALVLCAAPLFENFRLGQVYVGLLFLFSLALFFYERTKKIPSGTGLGIAWILKTSGALVWILFVARREWRVLLGGAVAITLGVIVSLPFVGIETWRVYVTQAFPAFLDSAEHTITAYQTMDGFLQHFLRYDSQLNPAPLWNVPTLARFLYIAFGIVAVGVSLFRTRAQSFRIAFAIFLTLSVIFSPVAEEYHFVLLILPMFVFAANLSRATHTLVLALFCVALLLLGLPLDYKNPGLAQGTLAFLAYPRLYGAWLLWAILIFGTPEINRIKAAPV